MWEGTYLDDHAVIAAVKKGQDALTKRGEDDVILEKSDVAYGSVGLEHNESKRVRKS